MHFLSGTGLCGQVEISETFMQLDTASSDLTIALPRIQAKIDSIYVMQPVSELVRNTTDGEDEPSKRSIDIHHTLVEYRSKFNER